MCNLFCCFGCLTLCGCRDRVTRRLVFFPPPCTYAVEEISQQPQQHCMYLLTDRGERVEGYASPNFHYTTVRTKRRQRIAAVFISHPASSTTLLFSHGNATDLGCMRPHLVDLSEQLAVNVMAYDYSGYGLSTGQPTAANCNADIAAIYQHLRTTHPTACQRVILYGQSLGSGPTLYQASRVCVSGVIIHSGLMSCLRVLDPTVPSTPFYDIFPNIDLIPKALASPPIFLLHGEKDVEIPALHAQRLFEVAKQPHSLWLVNEAGHNDVEVRERAEYWRRLNEFVKFVEANVQPVEEAERRVKEEKAAGRAKAG